MNKLRKTAATLSILVLSAAVNTGTVSASEEAAYEYVYNDAFWDTSTHKACIDYEDGTKKDVTPYIFKLEKIETAKQVQEEGDEEGDAGETGQGEREAGEAASGRVTADKAASGSEDSDRAAYCCDVKTTIRTEQQYKCINLEDADYFDADTAEKLRGILMAGYWYDWDSQDLTAAATAVNQWAAAQGKEGDLSGLTKDEAMTATQAAIWYTACDPDSDADIKSIVPYGKTADDSEAAAKIAHHIGLFYEYLLSQPQTASKKVILTDDRFIADDYAERSDDGAVRYRFKLDTDITEEDELSLVATLGSDCQSLLLTGDGSLMPDEDGYYEIIFHDVPQQDLTGTVMLAVSGRQAVDGIYFYEAKPAEAHTARSTSQNLIGKMAGMISVYGERMFQLSGLMEDIEGGTDKAEEDQQSSGSNTELRKMTPGQSDEAAAGTGVTAMDQAVATEDPFPVLPWLMTTAMALMTGAWMRLSGRKRKEKVWSRFV